VPATLKAGLVRQFDLKCAEIGDGEQGKARSAAKHVSGLAASSETKGNCSRLLTGLLRVGADGMVDGGLAA